MVFEIPCPELAAALQCQLHASVGIHVAGGGVASGEGFEERGGSPKACEVGATRLERHLAEEHTVDIDDGESVSTVDDVPEDVAGREVAVQQMGVMHPCRHASEGFGEGRVLFGREIEHIVEAVAVGALYAYEIGIAYKSEPPLLYVCHSLGRLYAGSIEQRRIDEGTLALCHAHSGGIDDGVRERRTVVTFHVEECAVGSPQHLDEVAGGIYGLALGEHEPGYGDDEVAQMGVFGERSMGVRS